MTSSTLVKTCCNIWWMHCLVWLPRSHQQWTNVCFFAASTSSPAWNIMFTERRKKGSTAIKSLRLGKCANEKIRNCRVVGTHRSSQHIRPIFDPWPAWITRWDLLKAFDQWVPSNGSEETAKTCRATCVTMAHHFVMCVNDFFCGKNETIELLGA